MKKIVISIITVITMLTAFTGCSSQAAEKSKLEEIKKKGVLVIGTSAAYPPYEFHIIDDGVDTIVGFDIEIAKAIADDLGVELEIKDMNFDAVLTGVTSGMIDLGIAGITPTDERKESADFSKVYYQAKQAVLVKADLSEEFTSAESLYGKTVGVQTGTTQEQIASGLESVNVKSLAKASDLVLELKSEKIDAVMLELPVAASYAKQNRDLAVAQSVEFENTDSGSAVVAAKGESELIDAVNETIDKLISEGKIDLYVSEATALAEQLQD